jgi:tetratricopeptide (TPR) repeat protein
MKKAAVKTPEQRTGRWVMHPMGKRATSQQATPDVLPIPPREVARVEKGTATVGEIGKWVARFVSEEPAHPMAEVFRETSARFLKVQEALDALQDGDKEKARALFLEVVTATPGDLRAQLNLALCQLDLGDVSAAEQIVARLQTSLGGETTYELLRSRILAAQGKHAERRDLLWKLHKKEQNNMQVVNELIAMGDVVPIGFDPKNPSRVQFASRAHYRKLVVEQVGKILEQGRTDDFIRNIRFQVQGNKPEIAIDLINMIEKADPGLAQVHYLAALAYSALHQWETAERHARAYVEAEPDSLIGHVALGKTLLGLDRRGEARECFEKALAIDSNSLEAGEQYVLSADSPEQQADFVKGLAEKFPSAWMPHKLMGDLAFRDGQLDRALELHTKAWEEGRADDALTMLLHDLGRLGRVEESVQLVEKVADINRRSAQVRWNAANLLLQGGRVRPAVAILKHLMNDGTQTPEIRNSAANLLGHVTNNAKARL